MKGFITKNRSGCYSVTVRISGRRVLHMSGVPDLYRARVVLDQFKRAHAEGRKPVAGST